MTTLVDQRRLALPRLQWPGAFGDRTPNMETDHRAEMRGEIPENPKAFTFSYTVRTLMWCIYIIFIALRECAADLKSADLNRSWGFKSPSGHQHYGPSFTQKNPRPCP